MKEIKRNGNGIHLCTYSEHVGGEGCAECLRCLTQKTLFNDVKSRWARLTPEGVTSWKTKSYRFSRRKVGEL